LFQRISHTVTYVGNSLRTDRAGAGPGTDWEGRAGRPEPPVRGEGWMSPTRTAASGAVARDSKRDAVFDVPRNSK